MKITALEEYGMRCIKELAQCSPYEPVTVKEIARVSGLTIEYAGKILHRFKKAGLARSIRGKKGGYVIARSPESINIREILICLGGMRMGEAHCREFARKQAGCMPKGKCGLKPIWVEIDTEVSKVLDRITLSSLVLGKCFIHKSNGRRG